MMGTYIKVESLGLHMWSYIDSVQLFYIYLANYFSPAEYPPESQNEERLYLLSFLGYHVSKTYNIERKKGYNSSLGNCKEIELCLLEFGFILVQFVQV